ncbi:mammalian cell entry protein [Mycolicibacterium moriokaense]|uniref:MCE family protein n=1 Tax=Mycolicibacterium moriokaense TaxID=39691 RepID=UPI0009F4ADA8|nr:MCE family protein [Mycolicibacterium moriokaense]MCV7038782.1 MCE family protein [Mycolicibacterium moriokaense]ORB25517.1 mammalian cell entry protein [Mycolicibacterium moriokaense]
MKSFQERNLFVIGAVGLSVTAALVTIALQYDKLPFINSTESYSAYFAEAGGLRPGAAVQVAGYRVGEVSSVDLEGARVLVTFDVKSDVRLGEQSEANIRTKSLLGAKVLEITPRGGGHLEGAIPLERTESPYQLPDALGDLSATIDELNTDAVSDALATLADTFRNTPPNVQAAVQGVGRFAQTLDARDSAIRNLLANVNKATSVLSERADQVANVVANSNALLGELRTQSAALEQISGNLSALAEQLSGFIADNQAQLRPALDKLNVVLAMVDNRKAGLQQAIKFLNQYAMSLGESVASGPFFKAYIANLIPGQFIQPFVDAAFSDLGLDPNVLLPSQRTDPQVGQQATPALPMPYPRTGQGGEPRLTVPDAITGNPGDQGCGPPGLPLPGPTGCYPYREPLPAPPPGGPPPGPPAPAPASLSPSEGGQ